MKIKKLHLIFLTIPLAIFMCFCFLMPNFAGSVYAYTTIPQICDKTEDSVDEITYDYPIDENNGVDVTLCIKNFNFEVGDTLIYYFLKLDSDSILYLKLTEIIITPSNIDAGGEYIFDPFNRDGVGSYAVKATIMRNESIIAKPTQLIIRISAPTDLDDLKLRISYQKEESAIAEFGVYTLTAKLYKDEEEVSMQNYKLEWRIVNQDNLLYASLDRPFVEWTPPQTGSFTFKAKIIIGDAPLTSQQLDISIARDNTQLVIICLVSFALLLTTGVIISTVISVKKERIW